MKHTILALAPIALLLLAIPAVGQVGGYPGPGYIAPQGGGQAGNDNMIYDVIELKYLDAGALARILGGVAISIEGRSMGFVNMGQPFLGPGNYGPQPFGRGFYTPPPDPYFPRFGRPSYGFFDVGGTYGASGGTYGLSLGLGGF